MCYFFRLVISKLPTVSVTSGVPQGSALGALLCIIYYLPFRQNLHHHSNIIHNLFNFTFCKEILKMQRNL